VERGVTRYNVLQTVRALQSYLKPPSTFSHFTTLQPCMAYSNSALRRIRSGTVLEPCRAPVISAPSPSPSTRSNSRIRSLFANILPQHDSMRRAKKQTPPTDYLEVKSTQHEEHFCLKSESVGMFVPVHTHLPASNSHRRSSILPCAPPFSSSSSSSSSSNHIQGLYTVELLSQLIHQYPLITELVISRTLEENVPTSVGYPLRRLTLHRFVQQHKRILAFDMKNYAFLELDTTNPMDLYALEQQDTLFQRYQAQLRWCDSQLSSFRSQIKTVVHSSHGTAMFVQATPLRGQQLQQYHQARDSSSTTTSPLAKHIPQTIFTSPDSASSIRSARTRTPPVAPKFNTVVNPSNGEQTPIKGRTTGSCGTPRKDVRVYFNDPAIQSRLTATVKRTSFHQKKSTYQTNSNGSDSIDGDENVDEDYQCTAL
jgi:hypothetical protein